MITLLRLFTVLLTICGIVACGSVPDYLKPSGQALKPPISNTLSFSQYVENNKQLILEVLERGHPNNFQGNYTFEDAAELRAPFEWPIDERFQCGVGIGGSDKGFLLIHGLTDSPYLMRGMAVSIRKQYPCAIIRAIILPGHGTLPGDSIDSEVMTHENWLAATNYGFRSFDHPELGINSVYAVTFSTGAPLVVNHLIDTKQRGITVEPKLKGAVFLSAAIKASTGIVKLAPIVRHVWPWLGKSNEQDAARYESFSTHAAAEFYLLAKNMHEKRSQFTRPLFVAISADDSTVSAKDALMYFCHANTHTKKMIWYESKRSENRLATYAIDGKCRKDITVRLAEDVAPAYYKNFSHTSISVPFDDPHYGVNGAYKHCKSYFEMDNPESIKFTNCLNGVPEFVVGEPSTLDDDDPVVKRRGVYNPDYTFMEAQIMAFFDSI